jgi:hypothetical protein
MPAAPGAVRVVMERAPKRCPTPVSFHPDRLPQDLFGGGEDIDIHIACDLLSSQDLNGSNAQQVGDGSQGCANQGTQACRLAPQENAAGSASGGDGDQDE